METLLIDTNIIIEYSSGNPIALDLMQENVCLISYITAGELLQGSRNKRELRLNFDLIQNLIVDYGSIEISQNAIKIMHSYNLKTQLGINDAIIAATAVENNLTLVTENIRHFKFIKELQLKKLEDFN